MKDKSNNWEWRDISGTKPIPILSLAFRVRTFCSLSLAYPWPHFLLQRFFSQYSNMRYDKNGLPVREYYTEELKKPLEKKMKALRYQKYYTGGSIVLMFVVLVCMYLILN